MHSRGFLGLQMSVQELNFGGDKVGSSWTRSAEVETFSSDALGDPAAAGSPAAPLEESVTRWRRFDDCSALSEDPFRLKGRGGGAADGVGFFGPLIESAWRALLFCSSSSTKAFPILRKRAQNSAGVSDGSRRLFMDRPVLAKSLLASSLVPVAGTSGSAPERVDFPKGEYRLLDEFIDKNPPSTD